MRKYFWTLKAAVNVKYCPNNRKNFFLRERWFWNFAVLKIFWMNSQIKKCLRVLNQSIEFCSSGFSQKILNRWSKLYSPCNNGVAAVFMTIKNVTFLNKEIFLPRTKWTRIYRWVNNYFLLLPSQMCAYMDVYTNICMHAHEEPPLFYKIEIGTYILSC